MTKDEMAVAIMLSYANEKCTFALTPEQSKIAEKFINQHQEEEPLDARLYGIRIVEARGNHD